VGKHLAHGGHPLNHSGFKGVIIVETGLGHVNKALYSSIRPAREKGVHIFMTLQIIGDCVH